MSLYWLMTRGLIRFRYTSNDPAGTLGTTGAWPNGEVEDYALLVLGDVVWHDTDNEGDQDAGEPLLPNVVMNLLDSSGNPVRDA
ncbi:MAG: SdrD B-like domain-containing protein, partial [Bacteroidota bacterium]